MINRKQFTEDQIGGLFPDNTLIKAFDHHPEIKEKFNVTFSTLKEFFADKINYLSDTKKYIITQISKNHPQLKSFNDVELNNIEIKIVNKENIDEKIKKNIQTHIGINHYLNYAENTLATIKGTISFKSPLYIEIDKQLDFYVYINQSNFDILNPGEINFTYDIYYGVESAYDTSSPEIDVYFREYEKLGKIAKQEMFSNLNNEIKNYLSKLDLGQLIENDFRKTELVFYNLPSYVEFNKDKENLIEQLNNGEIDSKYLYDGNGASNYSKVVESKQYGLGKIELELLKENSFHLENALGKNIIDLGSGNGTKAKIIFDNISTEHNYIAVDSSIGMLLESSQNINRKGVKKENKNIDFNSLNKLENINNKTLLFLGSTLGNFSNVKQIEILSGLSTTLGINDNVIIGIDLEKGNIQKIINSYKSKESEDFIFSIFNYLGIKSENLELKVKYNPLTKTIESGVIFKKDIQIETKYGKIKKKKGDYVKCVNSKKFSIDDIENILLKSGLEIEKEILDNENKYGLYIVKKIQNKLQKIA